MRFRVGDTVKWTSQAGGFTKTKQGTVVAVVPAKCAPRTCVPEGPFKVDKCCGAPRDHESYLVRIGKRINLNWPVVTNLKRIDVVDVVDVVARAICLACGEQPDQTGDARGNDYRWQDYIDVANAAINAYESI